MVSKIEAAERLAAAVERMKRSRANWVDVVEACSAYRSASVPSEAELGRVAYQSSHTPNCSWELLTPNYRSSWIHVAKKVREWVQRDGLTDEERQAICDEVCTWEDQYAEMRDSILRKLGREPEPVWEWDNANAMWTLGGKVDRQVFPCASVMLSSAGLVARVYLSEMNATSVNVDGFKEACEWCEQKIREARQ